MEPEAWVVSTVALFQDKILLESVHIFQGEVPEEGKSSLYSAFKKLMLESNQKESLNLCSPVFACIYLYGVTYLKWS